MLNPSLIHTLEQIGLKSIYIPENIEQYKNLPKPKPATIIKLKNKPNQPTETKDFTESKKIVNIKKDIIPIENWEKNWLDLYEKTIKNPLVVWTYKEFYQDLTAEANQSRRKLLAYFLSGLNHKKGTHAFWATNTPNEDNSSLFWSGLELLKPKALVVFGEDTRDFLGIPNSLNIFNNERYEGKYVLLLPNMQTLVDEANKVNAVLAFLQNSLGFANR